MRLISGHRRSGTAPQNQRFALFLQYLLDHRLEHPHQPICSFTLSTIRGFNRDRCGLLRTTISLGPMGTKELKEILIEVVDLVASLEEEVRSLEILTSHRVNHLVTEKLGIPAKTNALHVRVQSLRAKVNQLGEKKDSSR